MSSVAGNGVGEHETTSRHVDAEGSSMASRRERKAVMRSEIAVPRRRVHNCRYWLRFISRMATFLSPKGSRQRIRLRLASTPIFPPIEILFAPYNVPLTIPFYSDGCRLVGRSWRSP